MISKSTLDPATKKMLDELLNKSPKDLTPDEIAFLLARRDYLNDNEMKAIPVIQEAEVIKPKAKRKYLK